MRQVPWNVYDYADSPSTTTAVYHYFHYDRFENVYFLYTAPERRVPRRDPEHLRKLVRL